MDEKCSISEFIGFLQNPDLLYKMNSYGNWLFWYHKTENESWKDLAPEIGWMTQEEKDKIQCVVKALTSHLARFNTSECMVQFWAVKEGCLTTVDQPFAVRGGLYKGYYRYRKLCEAHQYFVKEGAAPSEVGSVGRVYLNRNPESTPDLRLYSTTEFPLRNEAESCGLRTYFALPLFDLNMHRCYGVLEIVSGHIGFDSNIFHLGQRLKRAGMRSTHIGFSPGLSVNIQPESEISQMMKSAMELVPQLHLVQVWSPCNQCFNESNNLSCMQRIAFIEAKDKMLNSHITDLEMSQYVKASGFHHLQIGNWIGRPLMSDDRKSCFCRNICDFSICENPLAHYAQRARLSFCIVVHLQNVHNSNSHYLVEFFFQSNTRQDACDASFLRLLLKTMEKELKSYKFEKSIVELRKTGALTTYGYVEWKHQHLEEVNLVMKMHRETYLLSDFEKYFQKADLSCLQPCGKHKHRWVFGRQEISNNGVNNNTDLPNISTQETTRKLMAEMATVSRRRLVQFWAVGMNDDRFCLETSEQPFAVGSLDKGLAFFRKQCMERYYFVDELVGPLQRVFQSGHPETSPDISLYSSTEFPLRDHALHCNLTAYLGYPVFDHHKKCIGVLEYYFGAQDIGLGMNHIIKRALEAPCLSSAHHSQEKRGKPRKQGSRKRAEAELFRALKLFRSIPQLFLADVWVTHTECDGISSNISCMELFQTSHIFRCSFLPYKFLRIQTRKGIVGMALASENKSCFCGSSCDFSIADEPLAHFSQQDRLDVCFAVCLQSSHTGDLLYVLEFYLFQGPANYEYVSSFLHILLKTMEKELKSYKFEKSIVELRKTSALTTYKYVEWNHPHLEEVNLLTVTKMHSEMYLLSDFNKYFEKADLACLQQPCVEDEHGWIFGRQEISNNGVNNNTAVPNIPTQEMIRKLMTEISTELQCVPYSLVQFWAVGMNEDRSCLETSEQPFTVGSLDTGLAFFRKQCMERYYFVDELVGPLQRVFHSGYPETSHDLSLYSSTEFPLRDHSLRCNLTEYLGFPVFDQHKKYIGVLEYFGAQNYGFGMNLIIERALEAASLSSTHHNKLPTGPTCHFDGSREIAEAEIVSALELFKNIPQLFFADVWVTCTECDGISSNISCMELFQSSYIYRRGRLPYHFRRIQTRKGIVGMVLASENKSCFCRSSCDFSLADEPLAHYSQRKRLDVRFAVCLQSLHTGNLLYVLDFNLFQGPANYEYVSSFLNILFPIIEQELTSFRLASGQQLGDDLVVDVIEFPHGNHITSSGLNESCSSPFKFKTVVYGQQEPQHSINELPRCDPDFMDTVPSVEQAKPSNTRERGMGKRKVKNTGRLNLTFENLQPHFGKPLAQAARELGVSKATIKRACRRFGIDRWPGSNKYLKNPSLFEAAGTSHDYSSINIPTPDMSLPLTNAKIPPQPLINLMPESETVTVKAKYEDKIIKIKLCLSSTMNKLVEEVGRRLDLEKGSFELRYLDEDDDNILIACDDDLQLCFKDQTTMGRTTMEVFVQLILK